MRSVHYLFPLLAACTAMPKSDPVPSGGDDRDDRRAAGAAAAFLASLDPQARASAALPFDSTDRRAFNFVPMVRKGLAIGGMTGAQRAQVDELLRGALSDSGVARAKRIIAHEPILRELERQQGVPNYERRDSTRYYAAIWGAPSPDSAWGWRFEGHHLSVNVTRVPGAAQVVAPLFMGANPARVPSGPHAGLRILAAEEDRARELMAMLAPERRARAIFSDTTFNEIVTRNDPVARALASEGVAASEMSGAEREKLREIVALYASRLAPAAAREQLDRIERAGFEKLRFAWAGSLTVGQKHYYRVHGPTVLIEYDNSQNNANHIHTVWRDLERDFGGDLLRAHYAKHRHR